MGGAVLDLSKLSIPRHVALIIDGNGRWGQQRSLPRSCGHRAGARNVRPILEVALEVGVKVVTVYVFSTENWKRPVGEVESVLSLVSETITEEAPRAHESGFRWRFVGSRGGLPEWLLAAMREAEELTKDNDRLDCYLAVNYGGQAEIVEAARRIAGDGLRPEEIDAAKFSEYLYAPETPPVDLLIRTSGELRISNFLLWQAAYAEFYFTDTLWPDFSPEEFREALRSYGDRSRRWGGLGERAGALRSGAPPWKEAEPGMSDRIEKRREQTMTSKPARGAEEKVAGDETAQVQIDRYYDVRVHGYPDDLSLSDGYVSVVVDDSIEEDLLKEVKVRVAPVADELRAYVRDAEDLRPVALYVLDGRKTVNKLPELHGRYRTVLTYNFVPAGMGLLKDPVYGNPGLARSRGVAAPAS